MTLKGRVTLLSILACASLISVGFSAWTIQGGDSETINGTIIVDSVETRSYLSLRTPSNFKYTMDDFLIERVVGDGYIENRTTKRNKLVLAYTIDFETFLANFPHAEQVELQVKLSYSDSVMSKLEELEEAGTIDSASSYYDFFQDENLSFLGLSTIEGYEDGQKNDELVLREALLTQGISQFTFEVYNKANSLKKEQFSLYYESNLTKYEGDNLSEEEIASNELHAKYFGENVLNTSPLLFDIDQKDRFKIEAILIIRNGGDE